MQKALKLLIVVGATLLTGCSKQSSKIVVGASSTPHALILEQTRSFVSSKGYELEIKVFNEYVLPNYALEYGELDANYFQHEPYLNEFNASNGTHLASVMKVHFEPMGIYSGYKSTIESFVPGDKVVVPSDKSNYERAVDLLSKHGLGTATLIQAEAQMIPLMLDDCAFAVINGNYALSSNVINKCIVTEDKESDIALKMANIVAVKSGNQTTEKTGVLVEALSQPNIRYYITQTFGASVIPMF